MTDAERKRRLAAERTRRWRARKGLGVRVAPVPISDVDVPELLIEAGLLRAEEYEDVDKIGRVIGEILPGLLLEVASRKW